MKILSRLVAIAALFLLAFSITGCNTVEGFGEDVSAVGQWRPGQSSTQTTTSADSQK